MESFYDDSAAGVGGGTYNRHCMEFLQHHPHDQICVLVWYAALHCLVGLHFLHEASLPVKCLTVRQAKGTECNAVILIFGAALSHASTCFSNPNLEIQRSMLICNTNQNFQKIYY